MISFDDKRRKEKVLWVSLARSYCPEMKKSLLLHNETMDGNKFSSFRVHLHVKWAKIGWKIYSFLSFYLQRLEKKGQKFYFTTKADPNFLLSRRLKLFCQFDFMKKIFRSFHPEPYDDFSHPLFFTILEPSLLCDNINISVPSATMLRLLGTLLQYCPNQFYSRSSDKVTKLRPTFLSRLRHNVRREWIQFRWPEPTTVN